MDPSNPPSRYHRSLPSLDGERWVTAPNPDQLVGESELRACFRALYLKGLRKLYRDNALELPGHLQSLADPAAFEALVSKLMQPEWIVYQGRTQEENEHGEVAMKYLARYVTGTAISDGRLLEDDGEYVTFSMKDYRNGGAEETVRIKGTEFVRRFMMHILPKGFQRVRYTGMFSHRRRNLDLPRCRILLVVPALVDDTSETTDVMEELEREVTMKGPMCPKCEVETLYVGELPARFGWRASHSTTAHLARRYADNTPEAGRPRSRPP